MIPAQVFGRTGHESVRTIFGAAALGRVTQAEADRTMELFTRYGLNHIDVAASYGDAELRLAPWLKANRNKVFLATKTGQRDYASAHDEIRRSLERLEVEQIDLIQLHNLVDRGEWETALGAGGALDACIEAREEGLVRFIGVTGHGLEVAARHKASLERFDFDSVLLPYSYILMQNPQYAADFEALVALCRERDVAVQTIKAITRAPWGEREQLRATWYEPLEAQEDIDTAVHWVLGREGFFLNTVGDIHVLPKVLEAAGRVSLRPSDEQMQAVLDGQQMAPLFTT